MINDVNLLGRIGQDPKTRFSKDGLAITSFSVATTFDQKTEWHNIVVFGKLAEALMKFAKKGMMTFVQGRIETNEWTDKEGNPRKSFNIIAQTVRAFETVKVKQEESKESMTESDKSELDNIVNHAKEVFNTSGFSNDEIPF